jgi:ribosomal protein S18 acetylase RimI-like enzyme
MAFSIQINAASAHDIDAIVDLWRASGMLSDLNDPREDLEFALAGPGSTVLIATDESRTVVGSVMVGHDGHRGNIYYVAVAPECRKRGVGRQLMRAAELWLKQAGIRKIHLLVLSDNIGVALFYEKLGYGRAPATLLRKWLNGPLAKRSN